MVDFCIATNLFILNGRIGDSVRTSTFTCKDKSTIDYFFSTPNLLDIFTNLRILDFNPLFSDAHCPVLISVRVKFDKRQADGVKKKTPPVEKTKLWDNDKANTFSYNFDLNTMTKIGNKLSDLSNKEVVEKGDIETIVNDIGKRFINCAELSFGKTGNSNNVKKTVNKPWFNAECRRARNQYHYASKMYNKQKSVYNKQFLRTVSKTYKCKIMKCIKLTKQQ